MKLVLLYYYIDSYNIFKTETIINSKDIYGLLGILKILEEDYLGVIAEKEDKSLYDAGDVFRIKNVLFVPIAHGLDYSHLSSEAKNIIEGLINLLKEGFYFSYHYDITNTQQESGKMCSGSRTLFDRANKCYVWNYEMGKEFIAQHINTRWLIPIIQGFIGNFEDQILGKRLQVHLSDKNLLGVINFT